MKAKKLARNTVPLCFMPNGKLICYHNGDISVSDRTTERSFSLFTSFKERILGSCKFSYRLLRLGIRAAEAIDNNHIVLSIKNYLYELDIKSGELSKGYDCGTGIRPLIFTTVKDINGFDNGIYFGGYLGNMDKKPVHVYKRMGADHWKIAYTFPRGTINHIHNIVPDPHRQCLWIMTGDFGKAAALWKATDNFKKVEYVAGNDQRWRGCVSFAIPEGLIYATDTPFSDNHIYLFRDNGAVETLTDISGSCIYGCQWKDKYVFATTVEADGRDETLLRLLFGWKRGSGIKDNYVRLYIGNYANGFKEVYKERKDILPFIFQFGAFKFPSGINNTDTLYFQSVATIKNDLNLMAIKQ